MTPRAILSHILDISPFSGWRLDNIYPHLDSKLSRLELDLLFPHGTESLISEYYVYLADLLRDKAAELPKSLGVTGKVRWMILAHFEHVLAHPDAKRSAITDIFNPAVALQSPLLIAELMDVIWRAAGDDSTDMNYYTKRLSLGAIYVATLLYWYQTNGDLDEIMRFFEDRLKNLKSFTTCSKIYAPSSENILKNLRLLKTAFWDQQ